METKRIVNPEPDRPGRSPTGGACRAATSPSAWSGRNGPPRTAIAPLRAARHVAARRVPPDDFRRTITVAALALALLLFTGIAAAQDTPEAKAFKDAASAFQDGLFERAERQLEQFLSTFPASPMLPEAILLRARSAIELGRQSTALSLLNSNLSKAGPLADQYYYRIGEAHYLGSNYTAAAESFAALTRNFANTGLLLEAAHFEALARFGLRDFPRVVALLQNPGGPFRRAARNRPADPITARG